MQPPNVEAIYPLSATQAGIVYHCLRETRPGAYFQQFSCDYEGHIAPERLAAAWTTVTARHEALRSLITVTHADQPMQVVRARVALDWTQLDWQHDDRALHAGRWRALLSRDRDRGFELDRAPLSRFVLVRLGAAQWRFLWSFHHALLDGWSMRVALDEAAAHYDGETLPPAPSQAAAVRWRQAYDLEPARTFWRTQLAGFAGMPALAPVRAAEVAEGAEGAEGADNDADGAAVVHLSTADTQTLSELAKAERVTLATLLAGAHAIWLSRLVDSDDVAFGTASTGRPVDLADAERLVGMYANTLPLRLRIDAESTLGEWLRAVATRLAGAVAHEQLPLADIKRTASSAVDAELFDTLLVVENFAAPRPGGHLPTRAREQYIEYSHYPLAVLAVPGERLALHCVHDGRRVSRALAESALETMATLLRSMPSAADAPLRSLLDTRLAHVTNGARSSVLRGPALPDLASTSVLADIDARAFEAGCAIAVADARTRLTRRALRARSEAMAAALVARGVRSGQPVPVCIERSVDAVVALLGVQRAGAAYVPLDPAQPQARLAATLARLHAAATAEGSVPLALASDAHTRTQAATAGFEVLDPASMQDSRGAEVPASPAPDDLAYVMFTSGSTGTPKGVAVSHAALASSTRARNHFYPSPPSAFLLLSSLATDSSLAGLYWSLATGATLHLAPARLEQDTQALIRLLRDARISHYLCVPAVHETVVDALAGEPPAALASVIVAGDACPRELVTAHYARLPDVTLYNEYGPTEAGVWASAAPLVANDPGAPPIGAPIANVALALLDAAGQPVPRGTPGELYIAGASLADGYIGAPELTAERFVHLDLSLDGAVAGRPVRAYRSGDRARVREDGQLEFLGRVDHQLKLLGHRVDPQEVEAVLRRGAGVRDVAVALREAAGSERSALVAFVEADSDFDAQALQRQAATSLPDYMRPRAWSAVATLPRTAAGKLDREALLALDWQAPTAARAGRAAGNEAEARLAAIWAEVLGVESVPVDVEFVSLGGDSLLSIRILARAHRAGLRLTPAQFFAAPTVAEQALLVASAQPTGRTKPTRGRVSLLPIQRWFFERVRTDVDHWALSLVLRTRGRLDAAALERALAALLREHDALRARFDHVDGSWQQRIVDVRTALPLRYLDVEPDDASVADACSQLARGLRLDEPPLVAFAWLRGQRSERLVLVAHHLVADPLSLQLLVDDLDAAYASASSGHAPALPARTMSVKAFAERAESHADATDVDMRYWRSLEGIAFALPLDRAPHAADNSVASTRHLTTTLDATLSARLTRELPARYHANAADVLLTALAQALSAWTEHATVVVDVEQHGRDGFDENVDLSRTVGWFTRLLPVRIDVDAGADADQRLRATKEQLRAVPVAGPAHLPSPAGNATPPAWPVTFNYLGRTLADNAANRHFTVAAANVGELRSPRGERTSQIEINARLLGESLRIEWSYSADLHDAQTIEWFVERFVAALHELADLCASKASGGHTPSDFPLADLDEGELAKLGELLSSRGH